MLIVLIVIFGSHIQVEELITKSSNLDMVGFLDPLLAENKIQVLIYYAEVYHALHNLFSEGEAAPSFRKT